MRRLTSVLLSILILSLFAGPVAPQAYTVGIGDLLAVSVWGFKDLSVEVEVLPDGTVSLPLVGQVKVVGLTVAEIQKELSRRYAAFIKNPQVTVVVKRMGMITVSVVGEVKKPGTFTLMRESRVLDAIAAAGGLTDLASTDQAQIVRATREVIPLNLEAILKGDDKANLPLQMGDVIVVPEDRTNIVFVAGQVNKPGLVMHLRQAPTLLEALAQAGGLTDRASLQEGKIIRKSGETVSLDLEALLLRGDLSKNVPLKPGDLIFIPEGPAQIFVLGGVTRPGAYKVTGEVSVLEALSMAGGVDQRRAGGKAHIIRRGAVPAQTGTQAPAAAKQGENVLTLNLQQLLRGGDLGQNTKLRPGDVLFVEEVGLSSVFLQILLPILSGLSNLVNLFR